MVVSSDKGAEKRVRIAETNGIISPIRENVIIPPRNRSILGVPMPYNPQYMRARSPERVRLPEPELTITREPALSAEGVRTTARNAPSLSLRELVNSQVPKPAGNFDPTKFDPTWSFKMSCARLTQLKMDRLLTMELVKATVVKYSFNFYNFPVCSEEDLMLAVYFFLEETFNVHAEIELCVRYDQEGHNLVGVVLSSISMTEHVLSKAHLLKNSRTKLMRNCAYEWIIEGLRELHFGIPRRAT